MNPTGVHARLRQSAKVETGIVRFADGTAHVLTVGSASEFVLHPAFLRYYAAVFAIIALLYNRGGLLSALQPWHLAIMWPSIAVVCLLWISAGIGIFRLIVRYRLPIPLYTPLLTLPCAIFGELAGHLVSIHVFGREPRPWDETAQSVIGLAFVILILDLIFGWYVAPHLPAYRKVDLDEAGNPLPPSSTKPPAAAPVRQPEPPKVKKAPRDHVRLGKTLFVVNQLKSIRAEDHYLRIETEGDSKLVRGRFSDAMHVVPEGAGLQIHRSIWVATWNIEALHRDSQSRLFVVSKTGERDAVARSRCKPALIFAEENKIPIADLD